MKKTQRGYVMPLLIIIAIVIIFLVVIGMQSKSSDQVQNGTAIDRADQKTGIDYGGGVGIQPEDPALRTPPVGNGSLDVAPN